MKITLNDIKQTVKTVRTLPAQVRIEGKLYVIDAFGSGHPSPVPDIHLVAPGSGGTNPDDWRVIKITQRGKKIY